MPTPRALFLFVFSPLLAACGGGADAESVGTTGERLVVRAAIDPSPDAQVLGASGDRRWVAYGTSCDASDGTTAIKLLDDATGAVTELARGVSCMPGSVSFSPDGRLVTFGDGMGHLFAHDAWTGRTASVSRDGAPTIGIAFSPDARWFVVASLGDPPFGAAIDAWDADLGAHAVVTESAAFNPFAPAGASVTFGADAESAVFVDAPKAPMGIGTLVEWRRADRAKTTIAESVPPGAYALRDDGRRLAYLANAVAPSAPSPWMPGDSVVLDCATGRATTIERGVAANPLGWAGDVLVYDRSDTKSGPLVTLRAHDARRGATWTIDADVFASWGPGFVVAISPDHARVAYARGLDESTFTSELRVARLAPSAAPLTLATNAIPVQSYGWLDGGRALAFLHDPASTFPGAGSGTLSAWDATRGDVVDLGAGVTQIHFETHPTSPELLFVANYDMTIAAGDLTSWNAETRATRVLGHEASVMSIARSPDGLYAGFLALTPDPDRRQPAVDDAHARARRRPGAIADDCEGGDVAVARLARTRRLRHGRRPLRRLCVLSDRRRQRALRRAAGFVSRRAARTASPRPLHPARASAPRPRAASTTATSSSPAAAARALPRSPRRRGSSRTPAAPVRCGRRDRSPAPAPRGSTTGRSE